MLCSPSHLLSSREKAPLTQPAHLLIKDRIGADCELNFEIQLKAEWRKAENFRVKDMEAATKIFNPKCNSMLSEFVTLIDAARQMKELVLIFMLMPGVFHITLRKIRVTIKYKV